MWLEQVNRSSQEALRMVRGPAWGLALRNPQVWHSMVSEPMSPLNMSPPTELLDLAKFRKELFGVLGIRPIT